MAFYRILVQIIFLFFLSSVISAQQKDSLEGSIEFKIKKMIIIDYESIISSILEIKKPLGVDKEYVSFKCIKSMIIDSSSCSRMYKVKVLFDCSVCLSTENDEFEYWITRDRFYRINGFYVSDYFDYIYHSSFNQNEVECIFSKKIRKRIKKYYKNKDYEKISEYFYCNQLLNCKGQKLNRVFSRPIFKIPSGIPYGI
jgi:hypothetical protein